MTSTSCLPARRRAWTGYGYLSKPDGRGGSGPAVALWKPKHSSDVSTHEISVPFVTSLAVWQNGCPIYNRWNMPRIVGIELWSPKTLQGVDTALIFRFNNQAEFKKIPHTINLCLEQEWSQSWMNIFWLVYLNLIGKNKPKCSADVRCMFCFPHYNDRNIFGWCFIVSVSWE